MFSKPERPGLGDGSALTGRHARGQPLGQAEPRALVKEVAARLTAACPPLQPGCLGPRSSPWCAATAPGLAAPTIKTTIGARRRAAAAAPAGRDTRSCTPPAPRRAAGIRTTVSERRPRGHPDVRPQPRAGAPPAGAQAAEAQPERRPTDEEVESLGAVGFEDRARRRLAQLRRSDWVPSALALVAPLQLLSPWGGLAAGSSAGLALAAAPCGAPPPPLVDASRGMVNLSMPPMPPEEEEFAALIFPGFNSSAFIWQVTCWQVAEFVLSMCLGHNKANPTPCVLYSLGASWGPAITRGALWRLVSPVMLHANLTHLLFNVFFQLRMGFGMEKQFGRQKMMMIYFACGLFGNLMSVVLDPFKLAVGASTAGFGLIGVWLAEILLSWELLGPARERTIIWIVFMLISVTTMSSMTPNMDLYGHLGGALGGFLLSIIISDMREQDRPEWYGQARAGAALALAALLTGGLGKVLLFSPRDPLPDCPLLAPLLHKLPHLPKLLSAALS